MDVFSVLLFAAALTTVSACAVFMGITDFMRMKIPNEISLLVLACFAAAFLADIASSRVEALFTIVSHVLACGLVFAVTAVLFASGLLGAGDSKALSAYALWVGLQGLPVFLFCVTISGASLALLALCVRGMKIKCPDLPEGAWIVRVCNGELLVPYGIAIGFGALATFAILGYFDFTALWRRL